MPLESLDAQPNIHDLTLESEKKPIIDIEKRILDLKNAGFYEESFDRWKESLESDRTTGYIENGLLEVILESKYDRDSALKKLGKVEMPGPGNTKDKLLYTLTTFNLDPGHAKKFIYSVKKK